MIRKLLTLSALLAVTLAGPAVLADGMIVPVDPQIRVSGHWAVKYHHVDIRVRDQVASVSIDQEFVNTSSGMIEVEYLFPVPPDAAIDSMTLLVNGKEFAAKLLDADEARKIYEDIVRKKKDPALLEYVGFGLVKTRAFPLEPNKPARVVVTYKNICRKDSGLVEVWYPLNTEKFSARPIDDVRVTVDVREQSDIVSVYSPTHELEVTQDDPGHVVASYHVQKAIPVTDFQMFYKTDSREVGATLLTHQPSAGEDGYYMMLVSPNPRLSAAAVTPKDVVIVFDHSGSMSGEKMRQAREALRYVLENLNADDRFDVVAYNDAVEAFFGKLVPAEKERIEEAARLLDRIQATGGTNIDKALLTALGVASPGMDIRRNGDEITVSGRRENDRPTYVLFLTDGVPTVGTTDENAILKHVKAANAVGARLFAFGVGYNVNVRLLDRLVNDNRGRSEYVRPDEAIETKVSSLYSKIKNPVMTNLAVRAPGLTLRDHYPRELGDLFDGDQIVMVGRYRLDSDRRLDGSNLRTQLVVSGEYGGAERGFEYPVRINPPGTKGYEFIEKLWAIRRVGYLLDEIQLHGESQEVVDELVRLSKQYGIMTPYTSFLADERVNLAEATEVRERADVAAKSLARDVDGVAGQMHATNRQRLSRAKIANAPASAEPESAWRGNADVYGAATTHGYEGRERETITGVRQAGNQAIYQRRGNVWIAANASDTDLDDAKNIQVVERFSDEYFDLVRANSTAENQVLATQRDNEELVIALRGQVYQIR